MSSACSYIIPAGPKEGTQCVGTIKAGIWCSKHEYLDSVVEAKTISPESTPVPVIATAVETKEEPKCIYKRRNGTSCGRTCKDTTTVWEAFTVSDDKPTGEEGYMCSMHIRRTKANVERAATRELLRCNCVLTRGEETRRCKFTRMQGSEYCTRHLSYDPKVHRALRIADPTMDSYFS